MRAYTKTQWYEIQNPATMKNTFKGNQKQIIKTGYSMFEGKNEQDISLQINSFGQKYGMIAIDVIKPSEYAEATGDEVPESDLELEKTNLK